MAKPANPVHHNLPLMRIVKRAITRQVVATFNDRAKREAPVRRRSDGFFGPASVTWRVHSDVTTMMVGGIAALLLQMLHPAVLAGVWDHSNFRTDMPGRLRRTARFIALTTYAGRDEAEAGIARVRRIHDRIRGTLSDGRSYSANDPRLLAWVHVTETTSFLAAWVRYAEPDMTAADQDHYFAEMATIATKLGADPVPHNSREAHHMIQAFRHELVCDARAQEIARFLLSRPASHPLAQPAQALTVHAAVDLLPAWARHMHGLPNPLLGIPLVRAGTFGLAQAVRWAFA
jgi:uncharacterized protein (DUF2236 family)